MPWIRKRTGRTYTRAGYQGKMKIYKGARVTWAGKRSAGRTSIPRALRTGMQVQKHVIRIAATLTSNFATEAAALQTVQPLAAFVASGQYTNFIQKQFEEYRLVKASVRVLPQGGSSNVICVSNDTLVNYMSWDRNSKYGAMLAPTLVTVQEDPDTKFAVWSQSNFRMLYTSIIADKGHQQWLSTEAPPGTDPNNGDFFNPGLYWYQQFMATTSETWLNQVILELIIETRGFVNPR